MSSSMDELVRELVRAGAIEAGSRLEGAMRAIPPLVATPPLVAASSSSRTQDSHIPPADATARMLSVLQDYIHPNSHVLEIGTGSGYRAALLATLVGPGGHVTTVELDAAKAHSARRRLTEVWGMADTRVSVVAGDGTLPELFGCSSHGPCTPAYHAVLVSSVATSTPQHLVDLVLPLGALVMPVGPPNGPIRLKRLYKVADGAVFMTLNDIVHGVARLATTRGALHKQHKTNKEL